MSRPITARIYLNALRQNLSRVRERAPSARVWSVVKANAYGHGLLEAMRAFAQTDGLALVEFEGAIRLREAGWGRPILMLEGAFGPDDVALALQHQLSLVVHDAGQAAWLEHPVQHPIDVYLKINTGMNRLGVPIDQAVAMHRRLMNAAAVRSVTLMTHFANADLPGGIDEASARFERAVTGLIGARSLANSAAILDSPRVHQDWVRPGIMLYGATPFADRSAVDLGLRPAMGLHSRLIGVQSLQAGDAVGYGSSFVADRAMRIGIVAGGYADGYPRHAPTGTPVAVDGVRTRTVGRVSMDMLAVDLTPVPQAAVGAPVELWGEIIPVDEVAAQAGTIGYELLCAVAPRVRREVLDDGHASEDPVRL